MSIDPHTEPENDMRRPGELLASSVLLLAVGGCQPPQQGSAGAGAMAMPDSAALAAAADSIRSLDQRWVQMVADHDTAGIVDMYADDGRLMGPGEAAAVGHDAIHQGWTAMLGLPSVTFGPDVIRVSASGDLAYDIGHGTIELPVEGGGTRKAEGKYLVVWVKRDGHWKVMADMFNFNQPGS
jgi:uncharacterized protein (TIGR02246 family)